MPDTNIHRSRISWLPAGVGLLLVLIAVWGIASASAGLQITSWKTADGLPLTVVSPANVDAASRPLVLIGHGFARSGRAMRGYALTLAHAGYVAAAWDFDGHGANLRPLNSEGLWRNAESAMIAVTARGLADADRVAILGHSMGSSVALSLGQRHPDMMATIAISPLDQTVTPELPRNLLLMSGSLEPSFKRSAEKILAQAGGSGGDPATGAARRMLIIPGVEHTLILFVPKAHSAARDWLDATFSSQPGARPYTDLRLLWYGVGVLGAVLFSTTLTPLVAETVPPEKEKIPSPRRWLLSLLGGALGASLLLRLASALGLGLRDQFGLLVGGYLLIWFGLAGLLALLLSGSRPGWPTQRELLGGLLAYAVLWLSVGLLGHFVWLHWWLTGLRLPLWFLGGLLLLPWFLAVGEAASTKGAAGQVGWWLAHSIILAEALVLAFSLSPDLGFIPTTLPLLILFLGVHALVVAPQRGSWPFALSGALFGSWLLLSVSPLQ